MGEQRARPERSSLKEWPLKPDGTRGSSEPKPKQAVAPIVEDAAVETPAAIEASDDAQAGAPAIQEDTTETPAEGGEEA